MSDRRTKGGDVANTSKLSFQSEKAAEGLTFERPTKSGSGWKTEPALGEVRESAQIKILAGARAKKTPPKPEVAEQIGRHLRSVYNDVLSQPVPDRFLDLLREIDVTSSKGKGQK